MTQLQPRRNLKRMLEDLPLSRIADQRDAEMLCDYVGRCVIPDLRLQVWDITVASLHPFAVRGYVSNPLALNALKKAAEELWTSCNTHDVVSLPENGSYSFGLVTCPECPVYDNPEKTSRADTATEGETLVVLHMEEESTLVHSPSGYLGWVNRADFQPIAPEEWMKRIASPEATSLSDSQIDILTQTAQTLLGVPYAWGGTNASGIDCSGFTRNIFQSIGINLPRDADQQFALGTISALPNLFGGMRRGDLLFFSGENGGVSHVGMAMDSHEFIHARGGQGVIVTRIDDDPELMQRFLWSKRVII